MKKFTFLMSDLLYFKNFIFKGINLDGYTVE